MDNHTLQIYKASAGSGKTFKLTEKFLLLAFRHPDYFTRVLAVTFTNKAAEEMKDRVLEELNALAENPAKADHGQTIADAFHYTEATLRKKAADIRDQVLHQYSRLSVSTIDSFVQKILRSFAYEIGAHTGYRIEMDMDKVVAELAEMLDQELRADKQLLDWLIRYATFRADEGKNWNFTQEIKSLAKIIFSEDFQQFTRKEGALPDKEMLKHMEDELKKIRYSFEKQMHKLGEAGLESIRARQLMQGKQGRNFDGLKRYLNKISKGRNLKDFTPSDTVAGMLAGDTPWYAKTLEKKAEKDAEAHKQLAAIKEVEAETTDLRRQLISLLKADKRTYITAAAILENLHTFGILSDLHNLLPRYREATNTLLISDANLLLRDIVDGNEAPFIFEKTGTTFQHILIDEFQDTSHFQWDNFRPLVRNTLSDGNYNLIVGDVKQSIYRWRGGDWNLLLNKVKQDLGHSRVTETSLEHNFRSHEQIIRMNNTVFYHAPRIMQGQFNQEIEANLDETGHASLQKSGLTEIYKRAYADSYQKPGIASKAGGKIQVQFVENKVIKDYAADQLPGKINALIREEGYAPGDIGILVRKNAESNAIRDLLLQYQQSHPDEAQYGVISPQSLTLSTSPAVRMLISAMHVLNDPGETIHLANLMNQYHSLQQTGMDYHKVFKTAASGQTPEDVLPESFIQAMDKLAALSVYEMTERLIGIFTLDASEPDQPYLAAFLDFALQFSRNESADLQAFINWWQESGRFKSVEPPESKDSVRILTIHKAKGLAFDVVLMPFTNWKMDHEKNPIIWCNPGQAPFNQLHAVPVQYKKDLAASHFHLEYFTEKAYAGMDALNGLYVAMTRAKREMHIYAGLSGKNSEATLAGDLLKEIMALQPPESQRYYTDLSALFNPEANQLLVDEKLPEMPAQSQPDSSSGFSLRGKVGDWRSRLSIKENFREFFIEADEETSSKVDYGTVMHEIMARIVNPEDLEPAVQSAFFDGKVPMEEIPEVKKKIRAYINLPAVRDWFYGDWEVYPEMAILAKNGEQYIADRVLEADDRVVVIDYKFGTTRDDYTEQVRRYMELLHEIFERPVDGYLYYPDKQHVQKVN